MTPLERAKAYTAKVPPAISGQGGHDATYHLACELVNGFALSEGDTLAILEDWNMWCQPPWTRSELEHKIISAIESSHEQSIGWRLRDDIQIIHPTTRTVMKSSYPVKPDNSKPASIPAPLPNPTVTLLRAAFQEGEGVGIVAAHLNDEGRSIPDGAGLVLTREEWINKLEARDNDPNKIWSSTDKAGGFIRINPLRLGGSTDADVTQFRHALLEFDTASLDEQYRIITASNIPCTAIIYSGAKSIHAWVKVDAKNRVEYATKVKELLEHFDQYKPDPKNKNPSRLARLAGLKRGEAVQSLLAVNVGAKSWSIWKAIQSTHGTTVMRVNDLLGVDTVNDPNSLIGQRWLCKGHACLVVGPSGVGKSTLTMQMAVTWAIGLPLFGVKPIKGLKSLVIQAENDEGDLSEQLKATLQGQPRWNTPEVIDILNDNLVFVRETISTGFEFCTKLQTLIDQHKPDLVWIDPLLSYIGDDIMQQKVASTFLRNWLAPILEATGVVMFLIHHVRKPSKDDSTKSSLELQYLAAGSSDVVNFSRAVVYLESTGDGVANLHFVKRGKRAGSTNLEGKLSTVIPIKHSASGPTWELATTPVTSTVTTPVRTFNPNPTAADVVGAMGSKQYSYLSFLKLLKDTFGCTDGVAKTAFSTHKHLFKVDESGEYKQYSTQ